jgi:hypothetical protein
MLGFLPLATSAFATAEIDQAFYVTGVQGTTVLGTATVTGTAVVNVTGVQAQTYLGTTSQTGTASVSVTGIQAQSYLGTTSQTGTAVVAVTGVQGTTVLGTAVASGNADVPVAGIQAQTYLGTTSQTGTANAAITGISATGQLGAVSVTLVTNVFPLGVQGTTHLGTTAQTGDANAYVTGVQGTGAVGSFMVWDEIDPVQNAGWRDVRSDTIDFDEGPVHGGATFAGDAYSSILRIKFNPPTVSWEDVEDTQNENWTDMINEYVDFYEGPMFGGSGFAVTPFSSIVRVRFKPPSNTWTDVNDTQNPNWQDIKAA